MAENKLNDKQIKAFKPQEKLTKLSDGKGLFLWIFPHGSKLWRYHYRIGGKQKTYSIGEYEKISLAKARELTQKARELVAVGIDPSKEKLRPTVNNSFKAIADEWIRNNEKTWAPRHTTTVVQRLTKDIYPYIGDVEIRSITPHDILLCLRRIETRGSCEVASRVLGICSMIFRYGVATTVCDSDPCRDLRGALVPRKKGRLAALTTPDEAGQLMRNINNYNASQTVRYAMLLSAYTFCRPGEIRNTEWSEIDFSKKVWIIPAEKMKARREHIVPLSHQAIKVLEAMRGISDERSLYVFHTPRTYKKPLSDGGVLSAIRRMGYQQSEMTAHGFRSMASTLLNENNIARFDVIEAQLAHSGIDKIRSVYNRAEYMDERKKLMQDWADYLDALAKEQR